MTEQRLNLTPCIVRNDFNDLHSVFLSQTTSKHSLWITNTGHDAIMQFDNKGHLLKRINLTPNSNYINNNLSDIYFSNADHKPEYLKKLPDKVHPNSILLHRNMIWTSNLLGQNIGTIDGKITVKVDGCPHDLIIHNNDIWFTTTDGRIWKISEKSKKTSPQLMFDTFKSCKISGWCRGLYIDQDIILVGMTRISRMPRVRWTERPFEETITGIIVLSSRTGKCIDFLDMNNINEHNNTVLQLTI